MNLKCSIHLIYKSMNFNSYFTIKHTSNLRILLLTLFFIVPLGTIYGQNQLITIAGKNITLLKAFDAIESQTQLSITYSRTKIDVNRTLSVDFKKQKLSIVLDKLLAGTGVYLQDRKRVYRSGSRTGKTRANGSNFEKDTRSDCRYEWRSGDWCQYSGERSGRERYSF